MKKKCVFKEDEAFKDIGNGCKFKLDNPREGGGASWEIEDIVSVGEFERI